MTDTTFKLIIPDSFEKDILTKKALKYGPFFNELKLTPEELRIFINSLSIFDPAYAASKLHSMRPSISCDVVFKVIEYVIVSYTQNPTEWPAPTSGRCASCLFCGKCANSLLNTIACNGFVPKTQDHITMLVYHSGAKKKVSITYDRGFCKIGDDPPVRCTKRDYVDLVLSHTSEEVAQCMRVFDSSTNILMYSVRPNKDESYSDYVRRVKEVAAAIYARLNPTEEEGVKVEPKVVIRELFIRLGHEEMLRTSFGNDPIKMAAAFFPGKTPAAIIAQFATQRRAVRAVTAVDVYKEFKKWQS